MLLPIVCTFSTVQCFEMMNNPNYSPKLPRFLIEELPKTIFQVMRGNGDSVLDLDRLVSPWSFWFCPWSCWFVTANLKRSFTRKEKPKKRKRKKKRKKLKQKQTKLFLRPQNDCAGGQKSSLLAPVGTFKLFLALFKPFSTGSNQMLHVLEHSKIA